MLCEKCLFFEKNYSNQINCRFYLNSNFAKNVPPSTPTTTAGPRLVHYCSALICCLFLSLANDYSTAAKLGSLVETNNEKASAPAGLADTGGLYWLV
jgi:hypothetical protein